MNCKKYPSFDKGIKQCFRGKEKNTLLVHYKFVASPNVAQKFVPSLKV